MTAEPEVLLGRRGTVGRITLNRPRALNALTLGMVREMTKALTRWREDDGVAVVLIDGAGERGLCAGGDIRALYDAVLAGDWSFPATFWAEEYRLNSMLSRYPKPVVAIMDGICMGGGVGISAHGSHRVVTERSRVGMPEVGIGFVPDVGGTYLLSHAPGELGTHLALTGEPVGAADAIHCGFADHYVPSESLPELIDGLDGGVGFAGERQVSELAADREWIDAAYSASTVEEIVRRLRSRPEEKAQSAAKAIETKSPTSLKVALRALRTAREFTTLEEALDVEFRVSQACARWGDFAEGVRAALVDKDRNPRWLPGRLDEVGTEWVDRFFAPLGDNELGLAPK
jgi:enoyl-CoA hydratase